MARAKARVLLVSGSRYWGQDRRVILERELGKLPRNSWIVHGGQRRNSGSKEAPVFTGVDYLADEIAKELGIIRVVVPFVERLGPSGGPRRNAVMVSILVSLEESGHEVSALLFHDDLEGSSRGTKNCRNLLEQTGVSYQVIEE